MFMIPHLLAQRLEFICALCALGAGAELHKTGTQLELFERTCGYCGNQRSVARPAEFDWTKVTREYGKKA